MSSDIEKLGTELEEERLVKAFGEEISALILGADPFGKGNLVQKLFASIHEKLLIMASAGSGTRVANPWDSGIAIGFD